jgi:hypothetical protein
MIKLFERNEIHRLITDKLRPLQNLHVSIFLFALVLIFRFFDLPPNSAHFR